MIRICGAGTAVVTGLALFFFLQAIAAERSIADDRVRGLPAVLEEKGMIRCRPAIRYFCRNIHVSCSGQSDVRTGSFDLRLSGAIGTMAFDGETIPDVPDSGPLHFRAGYALLRLRPDADYLKIEADGRYSLRIYRRGIALMSHGVCR